MMPMINNGTKMPNRMFLVLLLGDGLGGRVVCVSIGVLESMVIWSWTVDTSGVDVDEVGGRSPRSSNFRRSVELGSVFVAPIGEKRYTWKPMKSGSSKEILVSLS